MADSKIREYIYSEDAEKLRGLLQKIQTKIAGPHFESWIEALESFAKIEEPAKPFLDILAEFAGRCTLPIWKTIKLGVGPKTGKEFIRALEEADVITTPEAENMLRKRAFTVASEEVAVNLCFATTERLTGKDEATTKDIFDAIHRMGKLCPAEVAPQVCLQISRQHKNKIFWVAMDSITDRNKNPRIFCVEIHPDGRYLTDYMKGEDDLWDTSFPWLFIPRK